MGVCRAILLCDEDNLILATRAVQYLIKHAKSKDAYLVYGGKIKMYAKRNKKSISVRQVKP